MNARVALALAVVSVAVLGSGCGSAETMPSVALDAGQPGTPATAPAQVVRRFVEAASRGDDAEMWALLSRPTRASIGPTFGAFAYGTAPNITKSLVDFRPSGVLVSRQLDDRWAIGALRGRYEPEDGEPIPGAYAAALRRERGTWRLELDGLVIARLRPQPLEQASDRPELRAEAEGGASVDRMLLWVDGRAASPRAYDTSPFSRQVDGRLRDPLPAGDHAAVVFAATRNTADALAWTFEVGN